jgi:heme/copper-type cytochrome/quinol oxidase subunit 2
MTRRQRVVRLVLMITALALIGVTALVVYEASDHSARAVRDFAVLTIWIGVIGAIVLLAIGGTLWLVRRIRGVPGDR